MAEEAKEAEAPEETEETQETPETPSFDWGQARQTIQDEKLRSHAERFTDLESLVKGNLEQRQKLSSAIVKPGKDASEEDIQNYRKALGVPESPDKYQFEGINLEEADDTMKSAVGHWQKVFHDNNVPVDVAQKLTQAQQEIVKQVQEKQKQADEEYAKQSEETLRQTWGTDYENNREYANRAAQELFGEDFESVRNMEDKSGRYVLDNPAFMKILAKVGREMGEGRLGPVMATGEVESIKDQAKELARQRYEAMDNGDMKLAKQLDKKEKELWEKVPRPS